MRSKNAVTLAAFAVLGSVLFFARATGREGLAVGTQVVWGLWVGEIVIVECRQALGHIRPTVKDVTLGLASVMVPIVAGYVGNALLGAVVLGLGLVGLWCYLRYVDIESARLPPNRSN